MTSDRLCVGFAREDITPKVGGHLFGYSPDKISTGVHDRLAADALYIERKGVAFLLVSMTLGGIDSELAAKLRQKISCEVGIGEDHIVLCATHTHTGPITLKMSGWGEIDREYCREVLIPGVSAAAGRAYAGRTAARMGIGVTRSEVGINRRQLLKDGEVILGQNPFGVYDPEMTVISFVGSGGRTLGSVVHYSCHGTAAGWQETEISRDWPGIMTDRLEKESGAPAFFINGAVGDIGPRLSNGATVGSFRYMEEIGSLAALDAVRAFRSIREYREDPELKAVTDTVRLPCRPLPDIRDVDAGLEKYRDTDPEKLTNIDYLEYHCLVSAKKVLSGGEKIPDHKTFAVTAASLGPILFLSFPYEIFGEIALRLRAYSGFGHTLCLSNANGSEGYFPSQDQMCRGGYEIRTFISHSVRPLTEDADNRLIRATLGIIGRLQS